MAQKYSFLKVYQQIRFYFLPTTSTLQHKLIMEALLNFREIFWNSFHRPALESSAIMDVWEHLEPINTLLAGPFFSIYEKGNCNYIFADKQRFPDIHDPDDFLNWCIYHIEKYKEEIEACVTEDEADVKDKKILLYQTDLKMELADLAYVISKENFEDIR